MSTRQVVSIAQCDRWRDARRDGVDYDALAADTPFSRHTVESHVSGRCSHQQSDSGMTCPRCQETTQNLPLHIRACEGGGR
ncbi:hypothetical protein [Halomarina rubra]|uniref:Uncharacterized protein n=1 Tax=Halomarina rubra TaxID=2071873 RepID=A0ABD6B1G7_9EURY|nr:hypothetical protein [Halomarina rubra]